MYYIEIERLIRKLPQRYPHMEMLQTVVLQCPNCWEQVEIIVDCSLEAQEYVEDCDVCCSPMVISVASTDEGEIDVEARMENG
jgi:hypothetical protein